MTAALPSFILGYHGCDASVVKRVVAGRGVLRRSRNDYDWLGDGVHFWEHNPLRAYEFACEMAERPHPSRQRIIQPAVIGAIVDLRLCLNLLSSEHLELVKAAHYALALTAAGRGFKLPANTGGPDLVARKLDCAVIRAVHQQRADNSQPAFDTVRAAFVEGEELYENAGFKSKNHIQVCVRNPACIVGYFRPLGEGAKPLKF